ncbi:hypothetical protein BJ170DRAFT_591443 [Xylariales sp. AK1849]|nr:hypothetical protein BJ170DRAFT_591443 [Xylariales sp. AK1849]
MSLERLRSTPSEDSSDMEPFYLERYRRSLQALPQVNSTESNEKQTATVGKPETAAQDKGSSNQSSDSAEEAPFYLEKYQKHLHPHPQQEPGTMEPKESVEGAQGHGTQVQQSEHPAEEHGQQEGSLGACPNADQKSERTFFGGSVHKSSYEPDRSVFLRPIDREGIDKWIDTHSPATILPLPENNIDDPPIIHSDLIAVEAWALIRPNQLSGENDTSRPVPNLASDTASRYSNAEAEADPTSQKELLKREGDLKQNFEEAPEGELFRRDPQFKKPDDGDKDEADDSYHDKRGQGTSADGNQGAELAGPMEDAEDVPSFEDNVRGSMFVHENELLGNDNGSDWLIDDEEAYIHEEGSNPCQRSREEDHPVFVTAPTCHEYTPSMVNGCIYFGEDCRLIVSTPVQRHRLVAWLVDGMIRRDQEIGARRTHDELSAELHQFTQNMVEVDDFLNDDIQAEMMNDYESNSPDTEEDRTAGDNDDRTNALQTAPIETPDMTQEDTLSEARHETMEATPMEIPNVVRDGAKQGEEETEEEAEEDV